MLITNCPDAHRHLVECTKNCAANCGGGCRDHKHCTACNAILCHKGLWRPYPDEPFNPGTAASAYAEMTRAQSEADRWRDLWTQTKEREAEMKAAREKAAREVEERREAAYQKVLEAWRQFELLCAGNAPALAVLELHQPQRGEHDEFVCAHCVQHNGYDDMEQAEWSCETLKVMKDAIDVDGA